MPRQPGKDSTCSIARSVEAIGDPWSLLIVREALVSGASRFQEFREALGVAPNILSNRLTRLLEAGIFERTTYREPGSRPREAYHLTEAGRALNLVMGAYAEWGRTYRPKDGGTSPQFVDVGTGEALHLSFVTGAGRTAPPERLAARRTSDERLEESTATTPTAG